MKHSLLPTALLTIALAACNAEGESPNGSSSSSSTASSVAATASSAPATASSVTSAAPSSSSKAAATGNVQLKPSILREGQAAIAAAFPGASAMLVFHGGSGSSLAEIHETLDYGVLKMNIDTDTQYAFTRAIADHMFRNYDGVLKVDGHVGDKKA